MFRPSAAPRWKIATRIFLRAFGPSAAYRARCNQSGALPTPTIASAEFFRNNRRVLIMSLHLGFVQHRLRSLTVAALSEPRRRTAQLSRARKQAESPLTLL